MPKLPNVDAAYIELEKISLHLLNDAYNVGGPKAAFYKRFGFTSDKPEVLEAALLAHARNHEATAHPSTPHGDKFEIIGPLHCPDGRVPIVKAIWIFDPSETAPRLVTAYPA